MKRALVLVTLALCAQAMQASADPGADLTLFDSVNGAASVPQSGGYFSANFGAVRLTEPGVGFDPNDLFPLTVDPNDPPAAPSVLAESVVGNIYVTRCIFPLCSFGSVALDPDSITFDDVPQSGNAFDIEASVPISGTLGAQTIDVTLRLDRPGFTALTTPNAQVNPNAWLDEGQPHFDMTAYVPVFQRNGYIVSGAFDDGSGPIAVAGNGGSFYNRWLSIAADSD